MASDNNGEKYYQNREMSWLKFNERILDEADDEATPLCEKLSFLSIFQSNLDEFYMVRVGSLYDRMLVDPDLKDNKTGLDPLQQIDAVMAETVELYKKRDSIYENVMRRVENCGIKICMYDDLTGDEKLYVKDCFHREIEPLLSPMMIGPKQPFPFMHGNEIYAVVVLGTNREKERVGIIPCYNKLFKRLVPVNEEKNGRFMLVEELILHYAPEVFCNYKVCAKSLVKIVRNADIQVDTFDDEELDYRDMMHKLVKARSKQTPIRLDMTRELNPKVVAMLCRELNIYENRFFLSHQPLDVSFLYEIRDMFRSRQEFFYPRYSPILPKEYRADRAVMDVIDKEDRLLFYPYDSIRPFMWLLFQAASDPDVESIKMTLYRLAKNSKIIDALIEAAENGKEVLAVVELQARFDEENNIEWSRKLEDAGCHVVYGINGLKVHSKICLITKKEHDGLKYYTQIGTGNYNENTATLYTDFCFMTADEGIGKDVSDIFKALSMGEKVEETKHLLVAPTGLQSGFMELIDEEIKKAEKGEEAYIGLKMNSLTDLVLMEELVRASRAGVKVEMVIRGICCLIPGVPGYTDNISVISIVGRYLEHSRIYIFGKEDPKVYIASADWMTRNTTRRVEVAAPIYDKEIKQRIIDIFKVYLKDNAKAKRLGADRNYVKIKDDASVLNVQEYFCNEAKKKAEAD
ncbi:MAG: polyphosphate kinase 1 [Lachnospiraceae bacterium]|nr:polyphosphate kinase 1 [Lachnospiraceae bacterium]